MLRIIQLITLLFIANNAISQITSGKVKIKGTPQNAQIKLGDSILNEGQIYHWNQGIYKLEIFAEGFETYKNNYFLVYKDKLNSYNFKLKKYRAPKQIKTAELLSPIVTIPLTIALNSVFFPVKSLDAAKSKVETQKLFVVDAKENLEKDSWRNDLSLNQQQFEASIEDYNRAVDEHNRQVKKNNLHRIIKPALTAAVAAANLYYLYSVFNKRKEKASQLGLMISPNQCSVSVNF